MGYTTDFMGSIEIVPPLNEAEIAYLNKFNETRHSEDDPSYYCQWVPTEDGTAIEWNGDEKFYGSVEWMKHLINHFLKPGAEAPLDFLQKNHVCNGKIIAQGEDPRDRWKLLVNDNVVTTVTLE